MINIEMKEEKEVKEIPIKEATLLAKIMLAGFDRILNEFRKQFKIFLDSIPESLTNAVENIKKEV